MPGNTFGHSFRVTTWGESHGPAIGVVIDGCPSRLSLNVDFIQAALDKRRPGKGGAAETTRKELDRVEILSGVFEGLTTGTPISLVIYNKDAKSSSYDALKDVLRPGHGDMTYLAKYGIRDHRGGGRASGRETAARVAAGAVAQLVLNTVGIEVIAHTVCLGGIWAKEMNEKVIENNRLFCADDKAAVQMEELITKVRSEGDSLGGIVEILAKNVPAGLGEPVFDKLDADLAKALMSIGAVKGVEIGAGFKVASLRGSENNDPIGPGGFLSNNAGGILAGISNGDVIVCRVAVKPIPSISLVQQTVNTAGEPVTVKIGGRHDVSAIPRIVPVCQAMVRLVLADHLLRQKVVNP